MLTASSPFPMAFSPANGKLSFANAPAHGNLPLLMASSRLLMAAQPLLMAAQPLLMASSRLLMATSAPANGKLSLLMAPQFQLMASSPFSSPHLFFSRCRCCPSLRPCDDDKYPP